jgi:hypothetical protein
MKCPGQDTRYWKRGDIFDVRCPRCGRDVEFFRDDPKRKCRCGRILTNPKLNLACAEWCQKAEECLGVKREKPEARRKKNRLKPKK